MERKKLSKTPAQTKSRIRSLIWNILEVERWQDYDDFSLKLADRFFEAATRSGVSSTAITESVDKTRTNFFVANKLSKEQFAKKLLARTSELRAVMGEVSFALTLADLFPEILKVQHSDVDIYLPLDVEERHLQDCLRKLLRAKGAAPISDRDKDTAQEVADIEHFRIEVKGTSVSLAVVVKGYGSLHHKTVTWEDVSHQITKAYQRTRPDHILLAIAKDPTDGVITNLKEYSQTVGKPDLVMLVPPRDLARLLLANGFRLVRNY